MNFTCPEDFTKCTDGSRCIQDSYLCNHIDNCEDKSDELNCSHHCPEWTCDGHGFPPDCIKFTEVCNGFHDCDSYSNFEEDKEFCRNYTCPEGTWKCANGWQCIKEANVCDGKSFPHTNCFDGSDELPQFCKKYQCSQNQTQCGNFLTCVEVCVPLKCLLKVHQSVGGRKWIVSPFFPHSVPSRSLWDRIA